MKIGILGGTFDPPHLGHLALARAARDGLKLDSVIWVPAARSPFKQDQAPGAGTQRRIQMVQLMVANEPGMAVSDIELTRGGISYTLDTLHEMQAALPSAEFWLIMGADAVAGIMDWHYPEKFLRLTRLAVAVRPGTDLDKFVKGFPDVVQERIDLVPIEPCDASSTTIRKGLERGFSQDHWLTPPVADYIREYGLYFASEFA